MIEDHGQQRGLRQAVDWKLVGIYFLLVLIVVILARTFHPWEGGEGKVTTQYAAALTQLGIRALKRGEAAEAKELLERALVFPHNLGEGKLEGAKDNHIHYWLGLCCRALGQEEEAVRQFRDVFSVRIDKLRLAATINAVQKPVIESVRPDDIDIYVGIP